MILRGSTTAASAESLRAENGRLLLLFKMLVCTTFPTPCCPPFEKDTLEAKCVEKDIASSKKLKTSAIDNREKIFIPFDWKKKDCKCNVQGS